MTPVYKIDGTKYKPFGISENSEALPPGMYSIQYTMDEGLYFSKIEPVTDELIDIENSISDKIVADIENFLRPDVRARFDAHKLVYKRGILTHGIPGTGKTTTIAKVSKRIVERGGIVFFAPNPDLIGEVMKMVRLTNPDSTILLIFEELETWLQRHAHEMLSILDGELQVENIVTLATTNYISRIPSRIKNRPSRFALSIEIGVPDRDFREVFFSKKLLPEYQDRLLEFVEATEGFVVDQMKDVIISVCCIGLSLNETITRLKNMQEDSVGLEDYQEKEMDEAFSLKISTKKKPLRIY